MLGRILVLIAEDRRSQGPFASGCTAPASPASSLLPFDSPFVVSSLQSYLAVVVSTWSFALPVPRIGGSYRTLLYLPATNYYIQLSIRTAQYIATWYIHM